jgi:hypothetical protein
MVIMNKAGLVDLMAEGKIAAGTNVDLARTLPCGGHPLRDAQTRCQHCRCLQENVVGREIGLGRCQYVGDLSHRRRRFPRLGIAKEMEGKTIKEGAPALPAERRTSR